MPESYRIQIGASICVSIGANSPQGAVSADEAVKIVRKMVDENCLDGFDIDLPVGYDAQLYLDENHEIEVVGVEEDEEGTNEPP